MKKSFFFLFILSCTAAIFAQGDFVPSENQFRQLGKTLATPNVYRTASGMPGHEYWQQRADYQMDIILDDEKQQIHGVETITYYNNSPDVLPYLWIQLDQNIRKKESLRSQISPSYMQDNYPSYAISYLENDFEGGFNIISIEDMDSKPLHTVTNNTMLRIDLADALRPGESFSFKVSYWYRINDREKDGGGRSGMEYFEEDDNYLYTIAQFYPRMAVYNEVEGWQNKQFTGRSEFALPFGDYDVKITVPKDHIVAATGVLQNEREVLSESEIKRLNKSRESYDKPVIIVSEKEAKAAMQSKSDETRTWYFEAKNVRDFAFASSRRFIWDAMAVKSGDNKVMAMSVYPPEGNPLWEKYSTRVIAHTISVYSKHTFDFPYPVAWSVHTNQIGMEYPMVAFNGGRPEPDGTYSERTKWSMIGVVIHEVGHNYFPMIVNSDERQWTWMDEGLNTFLQGIAEREWDHNHPSPKGRPKDIVDYMSGDQSEISPIMINGDLTMQFSANAYAKPATGLTILRETILGRELFDYAFKQYAQQWKFKHPTPDDFFRIMEDASAVDLDWFWRGWFYSTDYVDISIEGVKIYTVKSGDPEEEAAYERSLREKLPEELAVQRNRETMKSMVERNPEMADFYDNYDEFEVSKAEKMAYERKLEGMSEQEKNFINSGKYYVQVNAKNIGGMVMPLILKFTFKDGSSEIKRVPAEIWSRNNNETSKVFIFLKEVTGVELDPMLETADCDRSNNYWPTRIVPSKFELYKYNRTSRSNPMQK